MKLGIYLDMRNPPGWRRPWVDHYRDALDRVVAAEDAGLDSVWLSEHHLFDDGYLPQPLTLASAVAARTRRLRIGIAILVGALRHPRHVAEEAAIVDLVSGGRLEVGIGAGYSAPEFEAFGADLAERYRRADECAAELTRLLDGDELVPPAAQRPFPVWLGYQGPKGARRAGRLGVGLLTLDRELLAPYREGLVEGGHDPASARMGGVMGIIVAEDPERTFEQVLPYYAYQLNSYRAAAAAGTGQPPREVTVDKLRAGAIASGRIPGLSVLSPDDAIAAIRAATDGLPVEHVYLWASVAGMPDALVDEHIHLMLTRVRPALGSPEGASE